MYNFLRFIILSFGKIFFSENRKKFISSRLKQDYSFLKRDDYIWVHCSSVGEVNLSEELVMRFYSIFKKNILVSVFTDTGYEVAQKKYYKYEKIQVIYFPLDDKKNILKILNRINLKLLVLIETEIWPNIINEISKRKIRLILVNGRISDKSFLRYKKISFLIKKYISKIDYFYMQTEIDKQRIIELGANRDKVDKIGNLKFDLNLIKYNETEKENYKKFLALKDTKIFVAGSTRSGEDELILEVFKNLKNYTLILVPRHIERVPDIEKLILDKKFTYIKYTDLENEKIEDKEIILVDKIGVLRQLYSIADICFVGGTLVNIGGHNLLEPLFYRKPLIFGTYTQNVLDISREILNRNIGYQVKNTQEFIEKIKDIEENKNILEQKIEDFFNVNKNISLKIVKRENELMNKEKNINIDNIEAVKENMWKHFFHSSKSNYNKYMYKLLEFPEYIIFDSEKMKSKKGKWKEFFNNSNPVAVEIGTGSGNFMKALAERNPNKNFIGLELRFKRLWLSADKCKKIGLKNVALLRKRGEELEEFLDRDEIDEMYINFPDPWEGNEKNRLIQERLFKTLEIIMKKSGKLFFKTDHDQYYLDVLDCVDKLENFSILYHTNDLHNSEKAETNIKTEFEQLFLNKHKKNINYIEIIKNK